MSCSFLFPYLFQLCVHKSLVMTKLQFPYQWSLLVLTKYGTDINMFNSRFLASIISRTSLKKSYRWSHIEFRNSSGLESVYVYVAFFQLLTRQSTTGWKENLSEIFGICMFSTIKNEFVYLFPAKCFCWGRDNCQFHITKCRYI